MLIEETSIAEDVHLDSVAESLPIVDRVVETGNPLSRGVRPVAEVSRRLEEGIEMAVISRVITETEAGVMREEANKCLERYFADVSAEVPLRLKPFLYHALGSGELVAKYAEGLDAELQREEILFLQRVFLDKAVVTMYSYGAAESRMAEVGVAVDVIGRTVDKVGIGAEAVGNYMQLVGMLALREDSLGVSQEMKNPLGDELYRSGLLHSEPAIQATLVREYRDCASLEKAVDAIPPEIRKKTLVDLLTTVAPSERAGYASAALTYLSLEEKGEVRPQVLKVLGEIPSEMGRERCGLARLCLANSPDEERPRVFEAIRAKRIIRSYIDGTEQMAEICAITDSTAEREALFWDVAASHKDYRGNPGFDVDRIVATAEPGANHHEFVREQAKHGYISDETMTKYGHRALEKSISRLDQDMTLSAFLALATSFGVTELDASLQMGIEKTMARQIRGRRLDRKTYLSLGQWGLETSNEVTESFDYNLLASSELGSRTWRPEQSVIDILQNHLDAADVEYAKRLVEAVYGTSATAEMLRNGSFDWVAVELFEFKERLPMPDDEFKDHLSRVMMDPGEVVGKIKEVQKSKPEIFCLLAIDGEDRWILREQLANYPDAGEIRGLRVTDQGLGYEEKLNALFAPTKTRFPFSRGGFGQGAKIAMTRLLGEDCVVIMKSSYNDPETGALVSWEGHPEVMADNTVTFKGTKRYEMRREDSVETGTTTEIIFDKATLEIQSLYRNMIDPRRSAEGLGRYVTDYQPVESYRYGSRWSKLKVSLSEQQQGRVYVQGLEVPAPNVTNLCFGYDFPGVRFLTGRDRTYVDVPSVREALRELWSETTDILLIEKYQDVIMRRGEFRKMDPFELTVVPYDDANSQDVHKQLLRQRFGIHDGISRVVMVDDLAGIDAIRIAELNRMGIQLIEGSRAPVLDAYFHKVYGDTVSLIEDVNAATEGLLGSEKKAIPEALDRQLQEVVEKTKGEIVDYLRQSGFSEEADFLEDQIVQLILDESSSHKQLVDFKQRYSKEPGRLYERDGFEAVIPYSQIEIDGRLPDSLIEIQRRRLKAVLGVQMFALASCRGNHDAASTKDRMIMGQGLADQIFSKFVRGNRQSVVEVASRISLSASEKPSIPLRNNVDKDRQLVNLREAMGKIQENGLSLDDIGNRISEINGLRVSGWEVSRYQAEMGEIVGRQYFRDGKTYETKISDEGVLSLEETRRVVIGTKGGKQVLLIGTGASARIGVIGVMPDKGALIIRDRSGERTLLEGEASRLNGSWLRECGPEGPTGLFTDLDHGMIREVSVEDGLVVFPIGTSREGGIISRLDYFMNKYEVSFERPGVHKHVEENEGVAYLETSIGAEYGPKGVWDEPIRIFGDVIQNPLDAYRTRLDLSYQVEVDGARVWVDKDTIMGEKYRDVRITGWRVQDDGDGYTTRGLVTLESSKGGAGQRGKYGEGIKMFAAGCARNGFGLRLASRNWTARVNSRPESVVTDGRSTIINRVGFDMEWGSDQMVGSTTEIVLPADAGEKSRGTWEKWSETIDPRNRDVKTGYGGLERYVRGLRNKEDGIRVGPVVILPNEPGACYEGGLIVPGAAARMKNEYLFGYDVVDGEIIATQERNMVNEGSLRRYLSEAFKKLPLAACQALLRQALIEMVGASKRKADGVGGDSGSPNYEEYTLIDGLEQMEPLRVAYVDVFGDVPISYASKARVEVADGYGASGRLTFDELQDRIMVMANEPKHLMEDERVMFGPEALLLTMKLMRVGMITTLDLFKTMVNSTRELSAAEHREIDDLVTTTAADMFNTLNGIYESPEGREVVEYLLDLPDRDNDKKLAGVARGELAEEMLAKLTAIQTGIKPMRYEVMTGSGGFASARVLSGGSGIAFSEGAFVDPAEGTTTTQHELAHIISGRGDYSTTFLSLLMLRDPHLAKILTT